MDVFTYTPSWNSQIKRKPKVLVAEFGDGYSQRTANGINNNKEVWSLKFNKRKDSEADAIEAFLETQNGASAFLWTTPRGVQITVRCDEWNRNYAEYNNNTISATFKQEFDSLL